MADLTYAQAMALAQGDTARLLAMLISGNQPDGTPIDGVSSSGGFSALATTLIVASGQTVSDVFTAGGYSGFGLVVPATFDGSEITFQTSADGVTFGAYNDISGTPLKLPIVVAGQNYDLPGELSKWPFWKLVCTTVQATTSTVFTVVGRV